jgi:uncharacterized phage-like protein YoqJ
LGNEYALRGPISTYIKREMMKVIKAEKPKTMISGMALGVDTIFALLALELEIPLMAAIPCQGQDRMWRQESKDLYKSILDNPLTTVHFVDDGPYTAYKMILRDQWMVNKCDKLLAVWNGDTHGGTYQTVKYAKSMRKDIIRINPNDYE